MNCDIAQMRWVEVHIAAAAVIVSQARSFKSSELATTNVRTLMRQLLLLVSSVIHGRTAHDPVVQTESLKSMFVEIVQRCVYCVRLRAHAMPKIHETIYYTFRSAITQRIRSGHIEGPLSRCGF